MNVWIFPFMACVTFLLAAEDYTESSHKCIKKILPLWQFCLRIIVTNDQ